MRFKQCYIALLLSILFATELAWASGFNITQAQASFDQSSLSIDATFDLQLSNAVDEALHNGVNIELVTSLDLFKRRRLRWDEHLAQWAFHYQIRYHSLTNRYILLQPQKNQSHSFNTLDKVFDEIERFRFRSDILGETLPPSKRGYKLKLRIALNKKPLPAPLKVLTYVSSSWRLKSSIHEWFVEQ